MGAGQTPPAMSWNFTARTQSKEKWEKLWAGAGKAYPDSLGKEGDALGKVGSFPRDWCSCSCAEAPVWEYPWPALEFLWEGAVWLGNCWLLRIQLSLRWDLLCSRNFPTLQQLLLWGGFIVNGSFPNKTIPCGKSCRLSCREVGGGAVGLNPWKLEEEQWD